MFSLLGSQNARLAHSPRNNLSRRELLRVGGLSSLGLTLPTLLHGATEGPASGATAPRLAGDLGSTFGRAKNVIYLWLQGGPPQHETFDPKPDAPVEVRGPFKSIATNVPGIRFCELLPRTACHADKLAVVRSLATRDENHDVSGYWLLTGYPYGPGSARQIKPTDWPYFGSIVKMLKPSKTLPAMTSVWIPDVMRLNDNVTPAGQTAGFLGKMWEPERFVGDPATPEFNIQGLQLAADLSRDRLQLRQDLLTQFNRSFISAGQGGPVGESVAAWDRLVHHAYDLVTSGAARAAFDLTQEKEKTRDLYGRHTWGQSVLLARRLIEAGVRLVHVNWSREPGDSAVDNPMWDTHSKNADRLQDSLCPQFDVTFDAFMNDMAARGLLDETLIVVIGEFGRTPRINKNGGRDHWGNVFSCALAGAGIRGGQVIGASDKNGAYPATEPILGGDLTATIFHLLGIDPHGMFIDKSNRPHPITKGEPIAAALGQGAATAARCDSEGDPSFVPPYDSSLLLDTQFTADLPFVPPVPPSREKGWRAIPLADKARSEFTVRKEAGCAMLGYGVETSSTNVSMADAGKAILAQEVRNARGGHYTFTIKAEGVASSRAEFESQFLPHFRCKLQLFRYADVNKDPRNVQELASAEFRPSFENVENFQVSRFLGSTVPNTNFPIGNGLGVAIVIDKKTPGALSLPAGEARHAALRIHSVTLEFSPRVRDDEVTT